MDHEALRELAAGAALDDLGPDERRELDRHLATCAACRALSADLDGVLGDLALIAPAMRPPAALRTSVLGALREPADLALASTAAAGVIAFPSASGDAGRDRTSDGAGPVIRWGGLAVAAVFLIATVGLGARTLQLSDDVAVANVALAEARAELAARQAAVALVANPGHVTVALHAEPIAPAAIATVTFQPGTDQAYLMADGLPATPDGKVYQLWYADAAGVHALGTFHHDGQGPFVAPFGVDLDASAAAMVTLEPEGGAVGEPGPQVIFGEL